MKINFEARDAGFTVWLNTLTRWVDLQADSFGSDPIGSASAPIVTAASLVGPTIYKNYVSQTWFPSSEPVDIGGGVGNSCDANPGSYTLESTGTAQTYATFTQFLEW